jgi:monovalent cation:H+ antiporter, CPA1 family
MHSLDLISVLTVLTAAFGDVNVRLLNLPTTIALMALTLLFSMILLAIGRVVPEIERHARLVVERFAFEDSLLHGMLDFLLFAAKDV